MSRILIFLSIFCFCGCGIISWPDAVSTGFEDATVQNDSLWITLGDQHYATSGEIDSVAFEGEFSLLARDGNQVVLEFRHDQPEPDAKYLLTVWCRTAGKTNGGAIIALLKDEQGFREISRANTSADSQRGWEKRELLIQLPPNHGASSIYFQLINESDDPVWFDNFELEFLEKVYYPEFSRIETMQIRISEPDMERLHEKRQEAFRVGYIDVDEEDWMRAEVEWGDTVVSGSLTLKGDQLYNLHGDKWSFRFKLDEGTIGGMSYITLHHPGLRNYLDEWLFHEVLKQEGIIGSEYGFTPLSLNGRSLGVYAFEERMLDEDYILRDTINSISRFKDLGYVKSQQQESEGKDPFEDAGIDVYGDDSFNKERSEDFKQKIKDFRDIDPDIIHWLNREKIARMLAICDLMEAYGALHWTNIRFVSDASSGMLELVGNDGFSGGGMVFRGDPFMAWSDETTVVEDIRWRAMYLNLFNDPEFLNAYKSELRRLSTEQYLNVTKLNTIGELKYYQSILVEEWPGYRFDYSRLYRRARRIISELNKFDERTTEQPVVYRFEPRN